MFLQEGNIASEMSETHLLTPNWKFLLSAHQKLFLLIYHKLMI